jgi:hypothetical protein
VGESFHPSAFCAAQGEEHVQTNSC